MNIRVDGKKIDVYIHDNLDTILDRIARERDSIPQYLRLEPSEYVIGKKYKLYDLKDEVEKMDLEQLVKNYKQLVKQYLGVAAKDIVFLWLSLHEFPDETKLLKSVDSDAFTNKRKTIENLRDYNKLLDEKKKDVDTRIKEHELILQKIQDVDDYPVGKFKVTDVVADISVKVEGSLYDIFDEISVSENIPFVTLKTQKDQYYKVYDKVAPPFSWLEEVEKLDSYISIRVLKGSGSAEKAYTKIVWSSDNIISIDVDLEEASQDVIENRLFESVNTNVEIISRKQTHIKGNFEIGIQDFDKTAFLDMITNNNVFSSLLFVNEFNKSAFEKRRMYVYYYPERTKNIEKSLGIVISMFPEKISVRVSRAKDKNHVQQFQKVLSKLFTLYIKEVDEIREIYSKLLGVEESSKKVPEKKSGKRYDQLKEYNEGMFQAPFYARNVCQNIKQPYIIQDEEADAYREKWGKDKIMEFPLQKKDDKIVGEGTHFVCEPRDNNFVYPGIKPNTSTTAKRKNVDESVLEKIKKYETEYPFVPCCYENPQFDKPSSGYNKYIASLKNEKLEKKKTQTYYLKTITDKPVPVDRNGQLPLNLKNLYSYETDVTKSIRRVGIVKSPNSFIHCMEKATNPSYDKLNETEREAKVVKIRKKLASTDFSIMKQQLWDFTEEEIKDYLLSDLFFDPKLFVKMIEREYDCNVFLYSVDSENPNGDIVIPRYKDTYLLHEVPVRRSVVILMFQNLDPNIPFRCEIIQDLRKKPEFMLTDETLIKLNIDVLNMYNEQFIIDDDKIHQAKPQSYNKLFDKIQEQMFDGNGKVSALNFEKCSLVTSPLAPFNVVSGKSVKRCSFKIAKKFAEKNGFELFGKSVDGKCLFLKGIIPECYIPVNSVDENLKVVKSSLYTVYSGGKSRIDEMQKKRQIAQYLKEYALFTYSHFGKVDYKIIKDWDYKIETLNKRLNLNNKVMYSDKKLVVPSKEVIDKLEYYIRVQLFNYPLRVSFYKEKTIVENHYHFVSDFRQYPNQLIFTTVDDLLYWLEYEIYSKNKNEIAETLDSVTENAYYYFNYRVGKTCIIQNVYNGELKRALYVSEQWNKLKINSGYLSPELEDETEFNEYSEENIPITKHKLNVFRYKDETYAAVLFFKQ